MSECFCTEKHLVRIQMRQGIHQQKTGNWKQETQNRKRQKRNPEILSNHMENHENVENPMFLMISKFPLCLFSDCLLLSLLSFSLSDLLCAREKLDKAVLLLHRFALTHNYFYKSISQKYLDKLTLTKPRIIFTAP